VAVAKSLLVVMGFTGLFHIVRQTSTAKGGHIAPTPVLDVRFDHQIVGGRWSMATS
jgi:hypothetical protein